MHNLHGVNFIDMGGDPESIIREYSPKLAEATQDLVVWLANELCSEGLLDTQAKHDILSTDGVPAYNKAAQLWDKISIIVKFQEHPRQALINVCRVMKKRAELASLGQLMKSYSSIINTLFIVE